jgi:hypothetical protein
MHQIMNKIISSKFIKKYWFDIIQTDTGYHVFNTQRKFKQSDRDGIGYIVSESECETLNEAKKFLEDFEKGGYDV